MRRLKKFPENANNFDEKGSIKPDHMAGFRKIHTDHKKKRSSKKKVKLTNVLLNKVFGESQFKKLTVTKMPELGEEDKQKLGITAGRNQASVRIERSESGKERPWVIKDTLPFNEIIFSRLYAIFAPGSAKVRAAEQLNGEQKLIVPASRYIEGRTPEQNDFTEEAIKHNGLADYLVTSIIFNASDAKLGNVKIDNNGRFAAFDFEEMLPHGTKRFSHEDFLNTNVLTKPYLAHMDLNSHFNTDEISHSPVFQEEIYKAMIKFLVFPEDLLRKEISDVCAHSQVPRRDMADDYFAEIQGRLELLQTEAAKMDGFQDYLRVHPREELLKTCLQDFYTNSANGRYASSILPHEKEMAAKLDRLIEPQAEASPRRRV